MASEPDLQSRLRRSGARLAHELADATAPERAAMVDGLDAPGELVLLADELVEHARDVLHWYQPLLPRVRSGAMRGAARRELLDTDSLLSALGIALAAHLDAPFCDEALASVRSARDATRKWLPDSDEKSHLRSSAYQGGGMSDREAKERLEQREAQRKAELAVGTWTRRQRLLAGLAVAGVLAAGNAAVLLLTGRTAPVEVPLAEVRTALPAALEKRAVGADSVQLVVRHDWKDLERGRQFDQVLGAAELLAAEGRVHVYVQDEADRVLMHVDDRGEVHVGAPLLTR
jgi:hypothetical protein